MKDIPYDMFSFDMPTDTRYANSKWPSLEAIYHNWQPQSYDNMLSDSDRYFFLKNLMKVQALLLSQ